MTIGMLFYLRFRSQLRRARPDLIRALEDAAAKAISAAGGRVFDNRRFISASFDADRLGFWLNLVLLIEKLREALKKAEPELSGYALVLNRDLEHLPEHEAERLCRALSAGAEASNLPAGRAFEEAGGRTGIWCGPEVRTALEAFCAFGNCVFAALPLRGYGEFKAINPLRKAGQADFFPLGEKIKLTLEKETGNILLLGPLHSGIRDAVYHHAASLTKDIPPLIIRFNAARGPVCFSDALTPQLRAGLGAFLPEKELEELDSLGRLLFRERLRDSFSPFVVREGRRFFDLLLRGYATLASSARVPLILEEPLAADKIAGEIFRGGFSSLENRGGLVVYGISTKNARESGEWNAVFPRATKLLKDFEVPDDQEPALEAADSRQGIKELWEAAYGFFRLGMYFPAYLFPQLFEEEGLNPQVIEKALELLLSMGIIDTVQDPRPFSAPFPVLAEKNLGERAERIKFMVRNRLKAWESSGKIRPCFNFLCILRELGEKPEGPLILRAFRGDIFNGTCREIGNALVNGQFERCVGEENAPALQWVFYTLKALACPGGGVIHEAFSEPPPVLPDSAFPGFRVQIQANLCAYQLGTGNMDQAGVTIKELLHLNQGIKDGGIPAYRYFSLFNAARQRLDDALEYSGFAVDLAEKTGNREEEVKSSYFAGTVHFLSGNLSRAERFILRAEKTAADLGWAEWLSRSRFFRGRCLFEAGRYQEALELFRCLRGNVPPGNGAALLEAWIYRAGIFLAFKEPGEEPLERELSGFDAGLFMIEAAFLRGNYQEALDRAEGFLSALEDRGTSGPARAAGGEDFFFTEQPDWTSGFAQCEYISLPAKTFLRRQVRVYQGLAQSCLPLSPGAKDELHNRMQRMIREELPAEEDPCGPFYLYAWYRVLENTGAPQPDIETAVSVAFLRLQRRAARVDDDERRKDFLSLPYWNGALGLAARAYKLI